MRHDADVSLQSRPSEMRDIGWVWASPARAEKKPRASCSSDLEGSSSRPISGVYAPSGPIVLAHGRVPYPPIPSDWSRGVQPADSGCRYDPVSSCPICSQRLQTLDLPCPSCSSEPAEPLDIGVDASEVREFSETLHYNRGVIRYRPQEFVDQVNRWLLAHAGIVGISAVIHRGEEGVRGITFTSQAVLDPLPFRIQVACLPLRSKLGRRHYRDPGEALTTWSDANPDAHRLNHWVFAAPAYASEVWILFVVPATTATTLGESPIPNTAAPRRLYTSTALAVVTRLMLSMAFLLGLLTVLLLALIPVDPQPSSVGMGALTTGSMVVALLGLRFLLMRLPRSALRHGSSRT
jgi:hypothetical protein